MGSPTDGRGSVTLPIRAQHFGNAKDYRELNPGIGYEHRFGTRGDGWNRSVGGLLFNDSDGNLSPALTAGLHYENGPLSAGIDLGLLYREHRNKGGAGPLMGVFPRVEYVPVDSWGVSATYIPNPSGDSAVLFSVRHDIRFP